MISSPECVWRSNIKFVHYSDLIRRRERERERAEQSRARARERRTEQRHRLCSHANQAFIDWTGQNRCPGSPPPPLAPHAIALAARWLCLHPSPTRPSQGTAMGAGLGPCLAPATPTCSLANCCSATPFTVLLVITVRRLSNECLYNSCPSVFSIPIAGVCWAW